MNQILKGTETLFDRPRGTTVCPRVFCTKHCDAASCGCSPCFCDACMRQRILARRPTSRPRVRYTPPAPVQGHLFKEQS